MDGSRRAAQPNAIRPGTERIARLADGWFTQLSPDDRGREAISRLQEYTRQAGRNPSMLGMEARINFSDGDPEFWMERACAWRNLGATHISINIMRVGLASPIEVVNCLSGLMANGLYTARPTSASISSIREGIASDKTRYPSSVTSTSSSMRMPIPRRAWGDSVA